MNRREALASLAGITGAALSATSLSTILQGCSPANPFVPQVLSHEDASILTRIVDRIIPRTDTPGASDAGVVEFIDYVLANLFEQSDKEEFMTAFSSLRSDLAGSDNAQLEEIGDDTLDAQLILLDKEAVQARRDGIKPLPIFATLKELTLVGYYTSEKGLNEEMEYSAVQGSYDGCVPLHEVGRRWV